MIDCSGSFILFTVVIQLIFDRIAQFNMFSNFHFILLCYERTIFVIIFQSYVFLTVNTIFLLQSLVTSLRIKWFDWKDNDFIKNKYSCN